MGCKEKYETLKLSHSIFTYNCITPVIATTVSGVSHKIDVSHT